jgi:thiamine biosynthesis lipoprotein
MLSKAQALAEQSHHQFNPAIGHLIQLWGFQRDTFDPVDVSEQSLAQYLNKPTTMKDIVIDQQLVYSKNPYIKLDLGGYAKGYALDVAVKQLAQYGVKNALINIGGNIIAIGKHGDQPWRVGIQHPRKPNALASLNLESGWAIGTSGDYQRYFIKDGKRYCHIINPNTGKPAEGTQSVTVLIPPQPNAGTLSDVASKPIFIEDISKKQQAASLMNIKDYLIIQADGKVYLSPSMRPRLTWLDQEAEKVAKVLH